MKKPILIIMTIFLVLGLSACASTATPTVDSAYLDTIVAQSVQLTQAINMLTQVAVQQSATPLATVTPIPTNTPTIEPSITPTQKGVWVTTTANTNCRQGPATFWPIIMTLGQGTTVEGIARSMDNSFLYVRVIDSSVHYCWVYAAATVANTDVTRLQQYTAVPTDTPTITATNPAGFTLSYESLSSCSGKYGLRLNIKNIGNTTWQSIKIVVVDNTQSRTFTAAMDEFSAYSGCTKDTIQGDLTTNETAVVSNYEVAPFSYDPTNDSLTVTVSLFSQKGQSGTVISKSISVKP
jgi:hypothetical protein